MEIEELEKVFQQKGYQTKYCNTIDEASSYLVNKIKNRTVGFGDSMSLASLNLNEKLSNNNIVHDPMQTTTNDEFIKVAIKCLTTDIYISSVNAFSKTGELVNIDGTGNRLAGSLFGHEKVYFVIGLNKMTNSLDDAIWRARNIAAPKNTKRLNRKTPCTIKDKCYDCQSKERICNALLIYYQAMDDIESEIIFVNEVLGY